MLDHIAKPVIRASEFSDNWAKNISSLAKRENVVCKFSGLVTEVRDATWDIDLLRPYFEVVVESFTPKRMMFGSVWPVCLLRSSYQHWTEAVRELVTSLSPVEQKQILSETAAQTYSLGSTS